MMYASAPADADPTMEENNNNNADFDEPAPNLEVIYQAFGEHADLYEDVLQVKASATAEQIQMAYFDRRSELFALLASIDSEEEQDDITASHRFHAERKMDAVVMAVRILGDPQLRQEYDNVLMLRYAKKQPKEPPSSGASRGSSTREPDGVYAGLGDPSGGIDVPSSPRRSPKRRSPKRRSRRVSPSENDITDDTKTSDEIMMHHHHHYPNTETDYDFVESKESNSKAKSKKKKGHKKKKEKEQHHDHHHHQHHPNHNGYHQEERHHHEERHVVEQSVDQSALNQTIEDDATFPDNSTFPDDTVNFAPNDEGTIGSRTWDDQGTIASGSTYGDWTRDSRQLARGGTSTLSHITNGGFVARIQEEVAGTVEDTLVSFEQVLNVFTLQDRDIAAVMGRIDKAKRQLRKRR